MRNSKKQQKSKIFELSSRKGQGLSMNVIIIAALALLVLVILSVLVIQSLKPTGDANKCESSGGQCLTQEQCSEDGGSVDRFKTCSEADGWDEGDVCCRII